MQKEDLNPEQPKKVGRPKGSHKKKMTLKEIEDFIYNSVKLIVKEHYSWKQYMFYCRQNGLAHNQANIYWRRSWDLIKSKYEQDRDKLISKHLAHYWDIYDTAVVNNELSTARQVLGDISKLQGLDAPQKVDLSGDIKIKFNFGTPDEPETTEPVEE